MTVMANSTPVMKICCYLLSRQIRKPLSCVRHGASPLLSTPFCRNVAAFLSSTQVQRSTVLPPPVSLLKPLCVPSKLLMGPGPSNCSPRVLAAGSLPMLGHLHPEFSQILNEVKEGLRYAFQTKNEWTFAISGTGHAAMEATVLNLLEPGETALICHNGVWADRFATMVENNDSVAKIIRRPMGEVFSLEEIEKGLVEHKPSVVFIVFGESSGGTVQPLEGLGELCHKYNALLIVDAVALLGGFPFFMDDLGIDVAYAATQKVFSAPPSLAPVSFSQRARAKIANRQTKIRSYYFNLISLADHWGCDGRPRGYHHTEMVSSVYMLRESLSRLAEQGLETWWKDHTSCAELLYEGLEKLGLEFFVKDKRIRNPCVTIVKVPTGVSGQAVTDYAMRKYSVDIPGGFYDLADKIWRIGIMGYNSTPDNIRVVLRVLGEALTYVRNK